MGQRWFAWWAAAWGLYLVRLGAIITFLATGNLVWLFWHQVATGWVGLAILWAALVFSRNIVWRHRYAAFALFPLVWGWVAINGLDRFLLVAIPMVIFLSGVTLWTGWVFWRHGQRTTPMAPLRCCDSCSGDFTTRLSLSAPAASGIPGLLPRIIFELAVESASNAWCCRYASGCAQHDDLARLARSRCASRKPNGVDSRANSMTKQPRPCRRSSSKSGCCKRARVPRTVTGSITS